MIGANPQKNIKAINKVEAHRMAGSGDKSGTQRSYNDAPNFVALCLTATRNVDPHAVWASLSLTRKIKLSSGTLDRPRIHLLSETTKMYDFVGSWTHRFSMKALPTQINTLVQHAVFENYSGGARKAYSMMHAACLAFFPLL